jgi:hypothetical protein
MIENQSWLTRPLNVPKFSRKGIRLAWLAIFMTCLMLCFAPGLFTLGWHLSHGNAIRTRGKTIPVPMGWIGETTDSLDVSLTKLPMTISHGSRLDGTIWVSRLVVPDERSDDSWKATYWSLSLPGSVVSGPTKVGSGVKEAICMQSSFPSRPDQVSMSCLIEQRTWTADFWGAKKDAQTFFRIIQQIR